MANDAKHHRDRKNGSSREAWQKRKHEFNSARPKQQIVSTGTGVTHKREAFASFSN